MPRKPGDTNFTAREERMKAEQEVLKAKEKVAKAQRDAEKARTREVREKLGGSR